MTRPKNFTPKARPLYVMPDAILPCQLDHAPSISGERRLLLAVLEMAVLDVDGRAHAVRAHEREDARNFIRDDDRTYAFSFVNLCQHVGLDVGAVRRAVRASSWELPAAARQRSCRYPPRGRPRGR